MKLHVAPRRIYNLYNAGGMSEVFRGIKDFTRYRLRDIRDLLRQSYVRFRYRGQTIEREVNGHTMLLDTSDPGITTDLVIDRIREPITTRRYEYELEQLTEKVNEEIVVVDVGANIGYTVLTAAGVLGKQGRIYAIEPVPENVDRCRENVRQNGFDDWVSVDPIAIGDSSGTKELNIASHSNLHSFRADDDIHASGETLSVEVEPLTEFIQKKGLAPEDVNVLRMDVEGYEAAVLQSAEPILEEGGPMVLQIEFHDRLLDHEEREYIIEILSESGFEIQSAVHEGNTVDANDWSVLREYTYLQIVATRE